MAYNSSTLESVACCVLSRSSYCLGLLFVGVWTASVYYSYYYIYDRYLQNKLEKDVFDVQLPGQCGK